LEKKLFGWMLRLLVGDTTKLGMPKPDHALLDAHPLMNDQLLHYLRHGDVELRGDIERFEGPEVVFRDGSRLEVDLVLYATGYTKKIPYLDDRYLEGSWAAGNFLTCFSREFPRLFTLGFAEINGALYPHLSKMAELLGWVITAQLQQPEAATEFFAWTRRTRFDLTGGRKIIHTQRHEHYCDEYALSCALTAALRKVQKLAPSLPRAPAQLGS
jgi:hypothetical protein